MYPKTIKKNELLNENDSIDVHEINIENEIIFITLQNRAVWTVYINQRGIYDSRVLKERKYLKE